MNGEHQFDPKKYGENLRDRITQDVHDRIQSGARVRRHGGSGMWPGVILVIIGTAILLDHMGLVSVDLLWKFWPVILILVGAIRFVECTTSRVFSVMLMVLGALFLLGNLGFLHFSWNELWPVILIAAGVSMIWGRMSIPRLPGGQSQGGPDIVNGTAMFGGVERKVTTSTFKGGTVTATFGGVELDFRAADIEGEEAVLYVEAVFGGIEVIIPERWTAIYEGHSLFGGYSDETRPPLPDVPGAAPKKRLILRGQAVFGGITVKN